MSWLVVGRRPHEGLISKPDELPPPIKVAPKLTIARVGGLVSSPYHRPALWTRIIY